MSGRNQKAEVSDLRRAVVFSNGEYRNLPAIERRLSDDDLLICADGALAKVLAMRRRPHLLVGDFDSLSADLLREADRLGIERLAVPAEKDFTDTDLALREAIKAGCRDLLVVGAFGGRLDHALGNLFILPPYVRQGIGVSLTDGETDAYLITQQLSLTGCRNKVVSLLPLTEQVTGVTLSGFYYPLRNRTLRWGDSIGISNLPLEEEVLITLTAGILLVVVSDVDKLV